ncbi:MAG TPA: ABC transporter ATP-binding protein [Opitutaceae bacterium]|nr:ABC transporter ATP-binding protein [Opitutaceae bacterium]
MLGSHHTSSVVLSAVQLNKHYDHRPVLQSVSLEIRAGERLALTGPSGSGKTTLLNCLGGIDRPDSGSITILGHAMETATPDTLAELRRTYLGTIFQFFHLLPTLSAAENIELPLQLLGINRNERAHRIHSALSRVGLEKRAQALPSQLSGGEQQRIAIARALIHRPAVILADEPTGNLDSVNGEKILHLLKEVTDELRIALVLVTHSSEAAAICHRRVHLLDGKLVDAP